MGRKQKKKGPAPGSRGDNQTGSDVNNPSAKFIEEQARLLEMFSASVQVADSNASSSSASASAVPPHESVLEHQHRLLEAASPGDACGNPAASHGPPSSSAQASGSSDLPKLEPVYEREDALGTPASPGDDADLPPLPPPREAPASSKAPLTHSDEIFGVRRVRFLGRRVPMLMQSRNGPCSLLAVANGLLLRGKLSLQDDEDFVTAEALVDRLAALSRSMNQSAASQDANAQAAVDQVVERLPHLLDGLLVNCQFGSCLDFEHTADIALFDALGLRLFHLWVEPDVAKVVGSYNVLAERLAVCAELTAELEREGRPATAEEDEKLATGLWLEQWHEESRTQATHSGLRGFAEAVRETEVCVLFRNNHFSTVYRPASGEPCALLTDASFAEVSEAVWETIELDSASSILDENFRSSASRKNEKGSGKAKGSAVAEDKRAELVGEVRELGFSYEQAESALMAVKWSSTQDAVMHILEGGGSDRSSSQTNSNSCPSCGKRFGTANACLSHRRALCH